ncbi:energy transducer TonB [Sphingobacterium suaedae]|uniref:Energy transducer TonB n=1 Tax=Sphingobacterium suaedae TaxID=1686402 RepID=A0ABW5KK21_9SPHI
MKFVLFAGFFLLAFSSLSAQQARDTASVSLIDTYPQFKGGLQGWNRFVQQEMNLRKVVNAMDSAAYVDYGFRQTALLEFTVCEDGTVCEIDIVNKDKISPEFAEEAIRIMKRSPKWTPASKNGKGIKTRFKQSIVAVLD